MIIHILVSVTSEFQLLYVLIHPDNFLSNITINCTNIPKLITDILEQEDISDYVLAAIFQTDDELLFNDHI